MTPGRVLVAASILLASAAAGAGAAWLVVHGAGTASGCPDGTLHMARLELLFGRSRADAADVSNAEWDAFLDREVTPRFPDGLTVLRGNGQWRGGDGVIVEEESIVLLIWYEPGEDADAAIEAIRAAYKADFDQESVMRVDDTSCVSF